MIPITQTESFKIRELSPNTHITVANVTHQSSAKVYYMTCTRIGLKLLSTSNVKAREEYLEILNDELMSNKRDLNHASSSAKITIAKKIKQLENEIQELVLLDK